MGGGIRFASVGKGMMRAKKSAKRERYSRPKDWRIRRAIAVARRLLRDKPDDLSAGYRRGIEAALSWVIGGNEEFDRLLKLRRD